MRYLVDTGVLLRAFDRHSGERPTIVHAFSYLVDGGHELLVAVQNCAEFWNVSTRSTDKRGGGALPVAVAQRRLKVIERFCRVVTESPRSFQEWKKLVKRHAVLGAQVHDARLASLMIAEAIPAIITLNGRDFARYAGLTVLTPSQVVATS